MKICKNIRSLKIELNKIQKIKSKHLLQKKRTKVVISLEAVTLKTLLTKKAPNGLKIN